MEQRETVIHRFNTHKTRKEILEFLRDTYDSRSFFMENWKYVDNKQYTILVYKTRKNLQLFFAQIEFPTWPKYG